MIVPRGQNVAGLPRLGECRVCTASLSRTAELELVLRRVRHPVVGAGGSTLKEIRYEQGDCTRPSRWKDSGYLMLIRAGQVLADMPGQFGAAQAYMVFADHIAETQWAGRPRILAPRTERVRAEASHNG